MTKYVYKINWNKGNKRLFIRDGYKIVENISDYALDTSEYNKIENTYKVNYENVLYDTHPNGKRYRSNSAYNVESVEKILFSDFLIDHFNELL